MSVLLLFAKSDGLSTHYVPRLGVNKVSWMRCLPQEVLRAQVPAQASLQVLQELGEQLKQQVDTSAASAIQSDHVSLTGRLAAVEQALTRQLTTLQVDGQKAPSQTVLTATFSDSTLTKFPPPSIPDWSPGL